LENEQFSQIKKIWDDRAEEYSFDVQSIFKEAVKLQLLLETIKAGDKCLDVGSASGLFSLAIARHVDTVYALDLSVKMVELLRDKVREKNMDNLIPVMQNGEHLSFKNASVDVVFCYATLSLFPDPVGFFREVERVLVPGGTAILDVSNTRNLAQVYWSRFYVKNGYIPQSTFTYKDIQVIFRDLGFSVVKMTPVGLLDQWKYIPGIHRLKFLDRVVHSYKGLELDRDARWSKRFPQLANHWYFVIKKNL
jgi:ubiquinone/menaquinone biosynthesis C-methylase UbiE